jgi:hypothetical protein
MNNFNKLVVIAGVTALLACSSEKPAPAPFKVELRAFNDEGAPLAGVAFSFDKKPAVLTGADGRVVQTVAGDEGASLSVNVICPANYDPPPQHPMVRLTRTRSIDARATAHTLPVEVRCERKQSDVVVVVKAERGGRLPVLIDGKPVATTDDDGLAHVLLRRARSEKTLQVSLDTGFRTALKPVSPARTYDLHGRDAVVYFEQTFVTATPTMARSTTPRRHIPVRVD